MPTPRALYLLLLLVVIVALPLSAASGQGPDNPPIPNPPLDAPRPGQATVVNGKVISSKTISLMVHCQAGGTQPCSGSITLETRSAVRASPCAKQRPLEVGRGPFRRVDPGTSGLVKVSTAEGARRFIRSQRRFLVASYVFNAGAGLSSAHSLFLRVQGDTSPMASCQRDRHR